MRNRTLKEEDLAGLPGLRERARQRILELQRVTWFDAICIRDVGRKTARALLDRGLVSDPAGVRNRRLTEDEFERWFQAKSQD